MNDRPDPLENAAMTSKTAGAAMPRSESDQSCRGILQELDRRGQLLVISEKSTRSTTYRPSFPSSMKKRRCGSTASRVTTCRSSATSCRISIVSPWRLASRKARSRKSCCPRSRLRCRLSSWTMRRCSNSFPGRHPDPASSPDVLFQGDRSLHYRGFDRGARP
jgi:hypothetical protein